MFSAQASAQTDSNGVQRRFNNSINFWGADYYYPGEFRRFGILGFWSDDQVGVSYERCISKSLGLKVSYASYNEHQGKNEKFVVGPSGNVFTPGVTVASGGFKMVDLYLNYHYDHLRHHKFQGGIGISYTHGGADVVDSVTVFPGYIDAQVWTHSENKSYWGIVPAVGYDYKFLHDLVSVGIDGRYRYYWGYYFHRFEYGVHIAFFF